MFCPIIRSYCCYLAINRASIVSSENIHISNYLLAAILIKTKIILFQSNFDHQMPNFTRDVFIALSSKSLYFAIKLKLFIQIHA